MLLTGVAAMDTEVFKIQVSETTPFHVKNWQKASWPSGG